jgi:hypothetical protein
MAAERETLAAMLVVRANAVREAARAAEEAAAVAVKEEAARAAARVEELAEEVAVDAAVRTEMARDHRRWDEDMVAARRAHEIHELASERRHHRNLGCARKTDGEGSNAVDPGWGDALM